MVEETETSKETQTETNSLEKNICIFSGYGGSANAKDGNEQKPAWRVSYHY